MQLTGESGDGTGDLVFTIRLSKVKVGNVSSTAATTKKEEILASADRRLKNIRDVFRIF